jgi:hypothetical protein
MSKTNKYGKPSIGCYLDQGNRNVTELDCEVMKIAIGYGYEPGETDSALLTCASRYDWLNDNGHEALTEAADGAIDWLNEQETRSFLYWAHDGDAGAFGLWPNVDGAKEDCAFVSRKECDETTDPDNADYPYADYRGEWLHVSDHGNCTLYVRQGDGTDKEIWSIV